MIKEIFEDQNDGFQFKNEQYLEEPPHGLEIYTLERLVSRVSFRFELKKSYNLLQNNFL